MPLKGKILLIIQDTSLFELDCVPISYQNKNLHNYSDVHVNEVELKLRALFKFSYCLSIISGRAAPEDIHFH